MSMWLHAACLDQSRGFGGGFSLPLNCVKMHTEGSVCVYVYMSVYVCVCVCVSAVLRAKAFSFLWLAYLEARLWCFFFSFVYFLGFFF